MERFAQHQRRTHSARPVNGFAATDPDGDYLLTAEQLLRLVWNAAGATMAAVGVADDELLTLGHRLAATLCELVSDYGITIPDAYLY